MAKMVVSLLKDGDWAFVVHKDIREYSAFGSMSVEDDELCYDLDHAPDHDSLDRVAQALDNDVLLDSTTDYYDQHDHKWVAYHKRDSGNPDRHTGGTWFYAPSDSEPMLIWSNGYSTREAAVKAMITEMLSTLFEEDLMSDE